ncbi:MAG: tetratricopeptide repeat protein [Alphaproteobacteria bacterium]|nr:tetratricopeptide repeat protein [Alphaproteobacteria bacterium]
MTELGEVQFRVWGLVERGRFEQARKMLPEAFSLGPDDFDNHCLAGRVALELEDYEAAYSSVARALELHPSSIDAGLLMFSVHRHSGQFPDAERIILELLRDNPDDSQMFACYAELMLRTLHLEKAGALAAEALRLDPTQSLARMVNLLVRIIEGDREGAVAELEELVRDDPNALQAAWGIVAVLQSEHRYGEALDVMRGILHSAPDDGSIVEALVELRTASHWSTIPLWPLNRYGWLGSAALWALAIGSFMLSRSYAPGLTTPLVTIYLVYVVYSWVWPPLLKRWLRSRGF